MEGLSLSKERLYYYAIADRIKKTREEKGIPVVEMASRLRISESEYNKYENATYNDDFSDLITTETIAKIAIILGASFSHLAFADADYEEKSISYTELENIIKWNEEQAKNSVSVNVDIGVNKGIEIKELIANTYNNITSNHYYGLFPNFMNKSIDINLENMRSKSIYILILICSLVFLSMSYLKFFPMDASEHTKITNYQVLALMVIILTLVTLYVRSKVLLFLVSFIAFSSFVFAGYVGIWGTFFHLANRLQIRISLYLVAFIFAVLYTLALKRFQLRNTK
jgi:transcriptional regulator with XRE-family HTH domain